MIKPDTKISPPSEADQAKAGWRHQRRIAARERAEAAQWSQAIRERRTVRGGTFKVMLPREYSSPSGELDDHGRQWLEVTLPMDCVADPRDRWTANGLAAAAMRAAMKSRASMRPKPSREAAQDAASDVVARILEKRYGTLPMKSDVTISYLRQATQGAMIDAATNGDGHTGRAADEELPAADEVAEQVLSGGLRRAARDAADAMPLAAGIDPAPPHWRLSDRNRAVAAHAIDLINGPQAADLLGVKPSSVRVYLQRGRAKLARLGEDGLMQAVRDDLAAAADESGVTLPGEPRGEIESLMAERPPSYIEPKLEWPERTDDGREHPVTVRYADAATNER